VRDDRALVRRSTPEGELVAEDELAVVEHYLITFAGGFGGARRLARR
jgi:hypothetical protein